jgi:hypothetical protein
MTSFLCVFLSLSLANAVRVTPCMNINGDSTFNLASNLGWSVTFRLNSFGRTGVLDFQHGARFYVHDTHIGTRCLP